MSKKAIVVLLLVVIGLGAYAAYIASILHPYFAKIELETAWELNYSSESLTGIHLADGGTIFLSTEDYEFIAISPAGKELFRHQIADQGYGYGFDDGTNDTLWLATVDYVDISQLPQTGHNHPPAPVIQSPGVSSGTVAAAQTTFTVRLTGVTIDGKLPKVDVIFETNGVPSNLWCMQGNVYFRDTGQNLNCFDEQGSKLWVKNFPTMVDFTLGGGMLLLDCGSEVVALGKDGAELWRTPIGHGSGIANWTSWSTSGDRICILDNNDYVHVLGFDGQELWSVDFPFSYGPFGGYSYAETFAKIHTDNTVVAMTGDAILRQYSADGAALWHFNVGSDPYGFALGEDGTIYVHSYRKGLLAISPTGKLIWRDEYSNLLSDRPPVVGGNGLIYLLEDDRLIAKKLPNN